MTSSAAVGIERRGRFVEHEDRRVGGQGGPDRDALLLPAGQGAERAVAQVGEAEQVQDLLDALAHDRRIEREVLHRVRELLLDGVGHEPGDRVLADVADDIGELARRVGPRVAAVDRDRARSACRR